MFFPKCKVKMSEQKPIIARELSVPILNDDRSVNYIAGRAGAGISTYPGIHCCGFQKTEKEVDELTNEFIEHLKALPEKELYNYFYGNFGTRSKFLNLFLAKRELSYTRFKLMTNVLDELENYVEMRIPKPKKKKVVKKKAVESDSE
jgi:hypothetical protein